jgi:hypothetical protein
MQGVVDLAGELDKAGFQYQARNRSKAWELDIGWYPTSMYDAMEDPEHAVNKRTRPYQWLRREAISNLRTMQALARPHMTRRVLTPHGGTRSPWTPMSPTGRCKAQTSPKRERGERREWCWPQGEKTRGEAGPILRRVLRGDTRM